SEDRNQRLMDRSEHMLVVSQWLGRKFDGLQLVGRSEGAAQTVIFFSGNAAGPLWVAPLPERGDAGGLYVFRASPLRHEGGTTDLVVDALPYDGGAMRLDWGVALHETLLRDARTLQWYYQDGRTGEWTRNWDPARKEFPARIRLELGDEHGDWPPLVFALARAR
ncbi:MAG: prepilin-type N-terminal cleavage/methylation domain-containing protein, partial [Giesbergeria sp.]